MALNRTELLELFRTTATEVVEREFGEIDERTEITDLGIDSLGMMEIISTLERTAKVHIPNEQLETIRTVRDLIEVVEKRQVAPGSS
ncbi:MAG: acyl carrier protein [Myxococcales bacterium]|nr:acyl carrier protein [Myxococcales bacterium]